MATTNNKTPYEVLNSSNIEYRKENKKIKHDPLYTYDFILILHNDTEIGIRFDSNEPDYRHALLEHCMANQLIPKRIEGKIKNNYKESNEIESNKKSISFDPKVIMLPTNLSNAKIQLVSEDDNKLYPYPHNNDNPIDLIDNLGQKQHLHIINNNEIENNDTIDTLLLKGLYFVSNNNMIKIITNNRVKTPGKYYEIVNTTNNHLDIRLISNDFVETYMRLYNKGYFENDINHYQLITKCNKTDIVNKAFSSHGQGDTC